MDDYGDTLEAQLLADYVANDMTLRDACTTVGVNYNTTYKRIKGNPKFAEMMEIARLEGFDRMAENIRKVTRGAEGYSSQDVKRDRLIAEYDAKLLAKWHPKKYGEKLEILQKSTNVEIPVGDDPAAALRAYETLING